MGFTAILDTILPLTADMIHTKTKIQRTKYYYLNYKNHWKKGTTCAFFQYLIQIKISSGFPDIFWNVLSSLLVAFDVSVFYKTSIYDL